MTRAARIAVCIVVSLAMSSLGADAWAIAGRHHEAHRHPRHLQHDGSAHVLLALGRLDRQLTRSIRHRLSPLTDADRAIIRAHAASDQATVEAVAAAYSTTPDDRHLDRAQGLLGSYHPQRYFRATGMLRRAGHASDSIARLGLRVAPGSTDEAYLTAACRVLTAVRARDFDARTSSADMAVARHAVQKARALVARVRADLSTG